MTPATMVIDAPPNYEHNQELAGCPFCHSPNPIVHLYMPVRMFGFFDLCLYICNSGGHRFVAKQELLTDASHLKIYDRTGKVSW